MASAAKLATIRRPGIDPALKDFIDVCVVPMLVREYLSEIAAANLLAPGAALEVHSGSTAPRSASEGEG
jgi:hypothetical protein